MSGAADDYICPRCRVPVERDADGYACRPCGRRYPVLFGIPDFRLGPDRYLSLDDERAKAARLHAYGAAHGFDELVDHYYAITDDVPAASVPVFAGHVRSAPARSRRIARALGSVPGGRWLDLGCGSGGSLVADLPGIGERVGVDVALRWLVIARKRLDEAGREARLVCADADALPLRPGGFSHVVAEDLIDHVRDPAATVAAAAAMVAPGGALWVAAQNRWWPGPHPATGIWAAGLMPAALRGRVAARLRGVDVLRAVSFVSAAAVARAARAAGLAVTRLAPRSVDPSDMAGRSPAVRRLARLYARLAATIGTRALLLAAGPAFELVARRPGDRA